MEFVQALMTEPHIGTLMPGIYPRGDRQVRVPRSMVFHAGLLRLQRRCCTSSVARKQDRRFFLRHFFAAWKQTPLSSGLGEELGESALAELDGAGHQPASTEGHTPAARARDLGDQPVGMQRAQQAGDLAGLLFWLFGEREWSPSELRSEIAIGEAVQGVLTGEQDLEERAGFAGERMEGPRRPAVWSGGGASDGVELADGWGRVVDAGESSEVAGVALSG